MSDVFRSSGDGRLQAARALFPHIRKEIVYLNHAATSPLSTRVLNAWNAYMLDRSEGIIDNYPADMEMVGRCRDHVAQLIHAGSADRVAFMPNTSEALNVVASGYPWKSGDRLLLNELEFPANVYPYENLRRLGVELDVLPCPDGSVTPAMVEHGITSRTKMVALSAVQFLSGHRADLAAIGEICKRKNAVFVVDGIQAVGAVRLDVQQMHIDALAAGGQKWQMSPHGTGFLYVTEELQSRLHQQSLGWLSVREPWDFHNYQQPLASSARRYEGGSLNMPGLHGMEAALATLLEFDPESTERHILSLTGRLIDGFSGVKGFSLVTRFSERERAGIVTVALPAGADGSAVLKRIMARRVYVALREGKLRFSPHFYNTLEEIDFAITVTKESI